MGRPWGRFRFAGDDQALRRVTFDLLRSLYYLEHTTDSLSLEPSGFQSVCQDTEAIPELDRRTAPCPMLFNRPEK